MQRMTLKPVRNVCRILTLIRLRDTCSEKDYSVLGIMILHFAMLSNKEFLNNKVLTELIEQDTRAFILQARTERSVVAVHWVSSLWWLQRHMYV